MGRWCGYDEDKNYKVPDDHGDPGFNMSGIHMIYILSFWRQRCKIDAFTFFPHLPGEGL